MKSIIPYIGGKHRMARHIVPHLQRKGVDVLVDVFGGSGAVTMAAAPVFSKRVYNDLSKDLVNLFTVLRTGSLRPRLFRMLKNTPASRIVWEEYGRVWLRGGFSFESIADPVERAAATFYRHQFAFGGKARSGGLSVSTGDREGIKEIVRYRNTLRRLAETATLWRSTMIENLDAIDMVETYGNRNGVVLYCDPPYDGTENYYANKFAPFQHVMLVSALQDVKAHAVVSYYDTPLIRSLYLENRWTWHRIQVTKNSSFRQGNKPSVTEVILVKK